MIFFFSSVPTLSFSVSSSKYKQEVFKEGVGWGGVGWWGCCSGSCSQRAPLGVHSLDMGHRACSDHAKSLSSHAGAV